MPSSKLLNLSKQELLQGLMTTRRMHLRAIEKIVALEARLKKNEELLEAVMELSAPLCMLDRDDIVMRANTTAIVLEGVAIGHPLIRDFQCYEYKKVSMELQPEDLEMLIILPLGTGQDQCLISSVERNSECSGILSNREEEIAQLVCSGLSNATIASELKISVNTIKSTLSRIYRKLDITNRVQLAAKLKPRGEKAR